MTPDPLTTIPTHTEPPFFLTDGGLETVLVFQRKIELPAFAAFDLLKDARGRRILVRYFDEYLEIAARLGTGFVLETPTWRASSDWAEATGRTPDEVDQCNREAVALLKTIRERWLAHRLPILISGCVGPRGDGYDPGAGMTVDEAFAYHLRQVGVLRESGVDWITGITMTNVAEAEGLVRAAAAHEVDVVVSFTVETDGRLPSGERLGDAIEWLDTLDSRPSYYMLNCAHPTHFQSLLATGDAWVERIRGLRPNASRCSHAELDEAPELDDGDPVELGAEIAALAGRLPHLAVVGGCCGTDVRHVARIVEAVLATRALACAAAG